MHMALNTDEWMRLNTSYCNQLAAWITAKTCDVNRLQSNSKGGDLRCSGCNGLHDQVQVRDAELSWLFHVAIAEVLIAADSSEDDLSQADPETVTGSGVCYPDETELDDLIADLFPCDDIDEETDIRMPVYIKEPYEKPARRVLVFMGCCPRCQGFMQNDREQDFSERDEEVYRCWACGYRTSPVYKDNRALMALGLGVK